MDEKKVLVIKLGLVERVVFVLLILALIRVLFLGTKPLEEAMTTQVVSSQPVMAVRVVGLELPSYTMPLKVMVVGGQ